ncbi:hypothetical protein BH20ACI4_BH20ACI4_32420 [soil metagenome]
MEKTITFTMTERQAKEFENLLDKTLDIFNRWKKESPERDARFDQHHKDFLEKISEIEKRDQETSKQLAKWAAAMEK